jgi:four helix bundle protein
LTPEELKKRTKQFGLRVIRLVENLPKTKTASTIGGQLLRCGTSVGANYRAACRGRSKAELIAKLGVVEEEADESAFWIGTLVEAEIVKIGSVRQLHAEADELTSIMVKSRQTARRSKNRQS